ncbi:hypothetical protein CAEBREN_04355 [Caenorhabditis brenneri]|uniref:Domain of unknown function WSN domain-containing protein n=1 Tax=Caenorhabditis brenneri TaxID=135651 RepID=G0P309_CAEBE|nr:hypothetical protein CAEBREN_04355 [Caenorhabditis brenneri]
MEPRKLFLVTIILLVGINDFKAEQTTTLDEPLEKLSLISHLLNSIAIRNGFQSGYPNIHTGVAEFLKIPKRNSLLKFLDLDVATTMKLFKEFNNSIDKIKLPGTEESDKMAKLMWTLRWVTRYQGRLSVENIETAKEKIDKYQETLEEVNKSIKNYKTNWISDMNIRLRWIRTDKTSAHKNTTVNSFSGCFKNINEDREKLFKLGKELKIYSDLKDAIRTFEIFLNFTNEWNEARMDLKTLEEFLSPVNRSFSLGSHWLPMELRNSIQTLSSVLPNHNQPLLSISFLETQRIKYELNSDWFNNEAVKKNQSLDNLRSELTPVFNLFERISEIHPEWEKQIVQGFGSFSQNYTEEVALISNIFEDGGRISEFGRTEIECIQDMGNFEKINKYDYQSMKNNLEAIGGKVNKVNDRVRKIMFEIPYNELPKIMTKLEPVKVIVENTTLSLQERWDLIALWDKETPGELEYLIDSVEKILKVFDSPSSPTDATSTPSPDVSLDISNNYLKTVNITGVVKCLNESSLSKLDKLMSFIKNVRDIQGSQPILSKTLDLMEKAEGLQKGIRSVIKDATDSGKSKFQKIQNLQTTAEDVSHGIRSLQNIRKLLQNFDSITNLTQNLQNLPGFNNDDRIKIVNLWRELQDYNTTLASFPIDSNFSDLWSKVFQEAMKIRDVKFTLDKHLKVFSELPSSGNRDKIHVALKAFSEVETILERVLGPEEEEKVVGNTIKEGFTAK